MKTSPLNRSTKCAAAPAAAVSVRPSKAQLDRLSLVAALLQTTVEQLLLSATLASLDEESDWSEWFEYSHAQLDLFADGAASGNSENEWVELLAPDRMLRLAGYKFAEEAK